LDLEVNSKVHQKGGVLRLGSHLRGQPPML
jgi:hypothetical protein